MVSYAKNMLLDAENMFEYTKLCYDMSKICNVLYKNMLNDVKIC